MIFRLISIPFLTLLLFSCGSDEIETIEFENGNNFAISGTVTGAENQTFYLEALSQEGKIDVANGKADENGRFEIIGEIPGFGMYQLRIGDVKDKIVPLTLVPDDQVVINAEMATFETNPQVSGTSWGKVMTEYMSKFSIFHSAQTELMKKSSTMSESELMAEYMALKEKVDEFAIAQMKADPGNPFNLVLSSSATPSMGFENWPVENLDVMKSVAEAFTKKFPNSPLTANISNQVYQIELGYDQYLLDTSGERVAPEIALKTPEGKELRLSSLRGKYVLIDFWASWCGPCRRENPNLVRIYNEYKDNDFTIFSVSLDKNAEAWKEAIEKDGLIWPNHVSDLLQWKTPMVQLYGFNSIPHTVLIDKEGKIIGTGLRGETLEQKLKEIFKK
ncbi:MAG: AhpC/TSA family protein [Fluviicola sp.]|nr:AhpC/TSA family protein [Fluviicola sp.]